MPDDRWEPPNYPANPPEIFRKANDGIAEVKQEHAKTEEVGNFDKPVLRPTLTPGGSLEQEVHTAVAQQQRKRDEQAQQIAPTTTQQERLEAFQERQSRRGEFNRVARDQGHER